MRTYDERLNNIRAKADANKKAKRAIAATVVALSVFVLLIGSVMLWPELLFGARYEPTMGPVLQQPSLNDTPTVNTTPSQPNEVEPAPENPTIPASAVYILLPMSPTHHVVDEQRIDRLLMVSGCFSNYREIKKNCPDILSYLLNITPAVLEDKCEIYRFTYGISSGLAGVTFLVYQGEVYPLGIAVGGYGITEFAYINDGVRDKLYFIYSWGSGFSRSHVGVFDFTTKQEMASINFPLQDISFSLSVDGKKLGICQAEVYGMYWDTEGVSISRGDLLYEDILELDFYLAN